MASLLRTTNWLVSALIRVSPRHIGKRCRLGIFFPSSSQQQIRNHWQAFLTKKLDRTSKTAQRRVDSTNEDSNVRSAAYKYDDWDYVMRGFQSPVKQRTPLLERHLRNTKHVKPTQQKQRIKSMQIYRRSEKRVGDLSRYIKFVKDHNEDFQK
jgi:hypothetical protein